MVEDGASPILFYWSTFQATFSIPDWKNLVYGWQVFVPPILAAYILGSIPFGLILARLGGKGDLRRIGSGNIGATNVLRTGSKKLAAATLFLDGAKGYVAVLVPHFLFGPDVAFFTALAVVLTILMFPVAGLTPLTVPPGVVTLIVRTLCVLTAIATVSGSYTALTPNRSP